MKSLLEANASTIFDIVRNVINISAKATKGNTPKNTGANYLNGSISNAAKDLIMTFPVLCDNSLQPSTASMISRANERTIVTMLQILFSSMQFNTANGRDALASIHKNINSAFGVDDAIDIVDKYIDAHHEGKSLSKAEINSCIRVMTEALKTPQRSFPVESLNERSLNDFLVYNVNCKTVVREANGGGGRPPRNNYNNSNITQDEWDADQRLNWARDDERYGWEREKQAWNRERQNWDRNKQNREIEQQNWERDKHAWDMNDEIRKQERQNWDRAKQDRDAEKHGWERDNASREAEKHNWERNREYRDAMNHIVKTQNMYNQNSDFVHNMLQKQILDTDIKKANEMQPTLMIVNYNEIIPTGAGNQVVNRRPFVAGVKSRLISVDAVDIIERMISKNKTRVNFLNFIRATTGEIGFVKDFMLSLNQAKIDAKNSSKKGEAARIWNILELRSSKNYHNKHKRSGNDASAITTLVINQETVNVLKKEYDFDLEKINNTKMIMDAYNLLGIIICDESVEVAKVFYAGNNEYEHQAYSYLEKESNDNSYKKVINLIGKMNGR